MSLSFPILKFYDFWPELTTVSEIAFIVWYSVLTFHHPVNFSWVQFPQLWHADNHSIYLRTNFMGTQTEGFHVNHSVQCSVQNKWSVYINFIIGSVKTYLEYSKKIVVTSEPKNVIYFTLYKYIIYYLHTTYLYVHISSWEVHENLMSPLCW